MSDRVEKSRLAESDLDAIAEHLQTEASDQVALRFLTRDEETFRKLASLPFLGGKWESEDADLSEIRVWPVKGFPRHLVFYEPIPNGIRVVRVLHSSRDADRLLKP
jgi:toxin ParE1/3/4